MSTTSEVDAAKTRLLKSQQAKMRWIRRTVYLPWILVLLAYGGWGFEISQIPGSWYYGVYALWIPGAVAITALLRPTAGWIVSGLCGVVLSLPVAAILNVGFEKQKARIYFWKNQASMEEQFRTQGIRRFEFSRDWWHEQGFEYRPEWSTGDELPRQVIELWDGWYYWWTS